MLELLATLILASIGIEIACILISWLCDVTYDAKESIRCYIYHRLSPAERAQLRAEEWQRMWDSIEPM
jgi:hypothetical protein